MMIYICFIFCLNFMRVEFNVGRIFNVKYCYEYIYDIRFIVYYNNWFNVDFYLFLFGWYDY